ncbi:MAG: CHAT domain-containing protein [Nitrospirota bacterium]
MKTFELILTREGGRIRVCATDKPDQTLKQYEERPVSFGRIDKLCIEVLSVLNRANNRKNIESSFIEELKKTGQDLFDNLLTPNAKRRLLATSSTTLSLDIDDQLTHIPWELLYDGRQFLCRKFNIGRTVSTKQNISGLKKRPVNKSLRMLIIADPRENLDAAYREGIMLRDELIERQDRIKADLVSSRVDRQFVRRHLRDYDIVHYTGHAEYREDDPSKSGWLMSDGIWTAPDTRNLSGETPFPFLIFSNACHSGRAGQWHTDKGDYDLAATFLHCGVTHYVGTFLEINDSPGSVFAVEFYKAFSKDVSIGEAVRIARERLVEQYGESNTIWASYVLYGDPSYKIPSKTPKTVSSPKTRSKTHYVIAFFIVLSLVYFWGNDLNSPPAPPLDIPPVQTAAEQAGLEVSFKNMTGLREEDGSIIKEILTEESRMYLYDRFSFIFQSNKDAYYYLIVSDSHGKAHLLFHDRGSRRENSPNGPEYLISLEAHLLRLDEKNPAQAIYILSAEKGIEEIEPLLWEIEKLNENSGRGLKAQNTDDRSEYVIVLKVELDDGRIKRIR